jgi:hypothetical protein
MENFFLDYAIKNIWCDPNQDNQVILQPARITKGGVVNNFFFMGRNHTVPNPGKITHVFKVGRIDPEVLGLPAINKAPIIDVWYNIVDTLQSVDLMVNVYTDYGKEIPRRDSFYCVTKEGDLWLGVQENPKLSIDYLNETIYFRFYSNMYFQDSSSASLPLKLSCVYREVKTSQDILDIQNAIIGHRTNGLHVTSLVNGIFEDNISPLNVAIGDVLEYVVDSSIKETFHFRVSDLRSFISTIDNSGKFLLSPPGNSPTIDFQDDVDIRVVYRKSGISKGLYYHRNNRSSHRQLTHRDYSIRVDYVNNLINKLSDILKLPGINLADFYIDLNVRHAGYVRPLVHDNNRIFELYKLDYASRINAMVGLNSTCPVWKAENLEVSAYATLMNKQENLISMDIVQRALGYNAMSKIVGNGICIPDQDGVINLPKALYANCSIYEYDINGVLLEQHPSDLPASTFYQVKNVNCVKTEVFFGKITDTPDVKVSNDTIVLPIGNSYRVYKSLNNNDYKNSGWVDVTETNAYDQANNNLVSPDGSYFMIRTDKTILTNDVIIDASVGTMIFNLYEKVDKDGSVKTWGLSVLPGQIDVFLNGRSLIRDIDYTFEFPTISINSKKFINYQDIQNQKVRVRMSGFSKDGQLDEPMRDRGFINYGWLSRNGRFDIRDDKVMRIVSDGKLRDVSELVFAEAATNVSLINTINGLPYEVKEIVVPFQGLTQTQVYELRNQSEIIDNQVSNYMTNYYETLKSTGVSTIASLYKLYSPFFSNLIHRLSIGFYTDFQLTSCKTSLDVIDLLRDQEYLLSFDPIADPNVDLEYIEIVPCLTTNIVELSNIRYNFLFKALQVYDPKSLLDVTNYVLIT